MRPVRLIHLHAGAMFVHILERSECVRDREGERGERDGEIERMYSSLGNVPRENLVLI